MNKIPSCLVVSTCMSEDLNLFICKKSIIVGCSFRLGITMSIIFPSFPFVLAFYWSWGFHFLAYCIGTGCFCSCFLLSHVGSLLDSVPVSYKYNANRLFALISINVSFTSVPSPYKGYKDICYQDISSRSRANPDKAIELDSF